MKVVIEIPDTAYEGVVNADKASGNWDDSLLGILCKGVVNGTPLPKGHGRLIDADELRNEYCESNCGQRRCDKGGCTWIDSVKIAPTIIEADKEQENAI